MEGPEAGAAEVETVADVDVLGVENLHEAGSLGVVVGGPAEAAGFIGFAEGPVGVPEDFAVAVDGAVAGNGGVGLLVDVDQRGGPGHLDARDAGGEDGVVLDVLRAEEGDVFADLELDSGFYEDAAGEVGPGWELGRWTWRERGRRRRILAGGVDGALDGGGLEGGGVWFGSVGGYGEGLGGGVGLGGDGCRE